MPVQVLFWQVPRLTDQQWLDLLASLPDKKRLYAQRFRSDARKQSFVAGHHLLQVGLSQIGEAPQTFRTTYGAEWEEISLDCSSHVQPNHPVVIGGISHSANVVACILSTGGAVGIDLEVPLVRTRNFKSLAAHFFADQEVQALNGISSAELESTFLSRWTLKESYIKALGEGISSNRLLTEFLPMTQADDSRSIDRQWRSHSFLWRKSQGAITVSTKLQLEPAFYQYQWDSGGLEAIDSPLVGQWCYPAMVESDKQKQQ